MILLKYFVIQNVIKLNVVCLFSLVHDVLSDEESSNEVVANNSSDTTSAFNVFPTSDDDQNETKNK